MVLLEIYGCGVGIGYFVSDFVLVGVLVWYLYVGLGG